MEMVLILGLGVFASALGLILAAAVMGAEEPIAPDPLSYSDPFRKSRRDEWGR